MPEALNADKLRAFDEVLVEERVSFVAKSETNVNKIQETQGCFQAAPVAHWFAFELATTYAFHEKPNFSFGG